MQHFHFILTDDETILVAGGAEVATLADAIHVVSDHQIAHGSPVQLGQCLQIGVVFFPPVRFQCSGHTKTEDGTVIPTWKQFTPQ